MSRHTTLLPESPAGRVDFGYKAIQVPTWDARFFDLDKAYESEAYCDEIKGTPRRHRRRDQ